MDDKMTDINANLRKTQASRAFGRSYLVFDRDGNEVDTIRGRPLSQVMKLVDEHTGEAWLDGRCVLTAARSKDDAP